MPNLSAADETKLLDAVKRAGDLVAGGLTPDEAVEKVARESAFGPGTIRLIGQTYNTGRQLAQWRSDKSASVLDKTASFPLCDPDKVVAAVCSSPVKAAAAPPPPRPVGREHALTVALGDAARAKKAADECRRQSVAARDKVAADVNGLVGYFRKAAMDRLPFHAVEAAAAAYCGPGAPQLMDLVYKTAGLKEKRAAAVAGTKQAVAAAPVAPDAYPLTAVKAALAGAVAAASFAEKAAALKVEADAKKTEGLRPFVGEAAKAASFGFPTEVAAIAAGDILAHKATHGVDPSDPYGDVGDLDRELSQIRDQSRRAIGMRPRPVKQAFFGAGIGTAIGSSMGRTMGTVGKTKDDMVNDAWMDLEDPEHQNELRKIKAHSHLNQLLTDPDDPISGHDPDKVLAAYNELSAATPRLAENMATLRPALRKRLESHQEPFEAKELLDIEHGLAKTKMPTPNTSILGDTPDKILG